MKKRFAIVDLFSGIGGLSYGFYHSDNFEIVLANEIDKDTAKAYSLNHPKVKVLDCDIKEIDKQAFNQHIKTNVDIVVGGPPCQSYSTLGKRKNDDKAQLFNEFSRVLEILNPKIFIYENVTGLISMNNGLLFKEIKSIFENLGYKISFKILNAVEFGVPQIRERVIVVGCRSGREFVFPKETHGQGNLAENLLPFVSLADALSDLPVLKSGEENNAYAASPQNDFQKFVRKNTFGGTQTQLTENKAPNNGEHLIKLMHALKDGETKDDLPIHLRPKSGYKNTYAKLWWNKPVPTVTRNFACVSSSRCIHPRDSRALTTREGARLQSFPDDFKFFGSQSKKNLQIGNAVPPLLSIKLAEKVYEYLKENNYV